MQVKTTSGETGTLPGWTRGDAAAETQAQTHRFRYHGDGAQLFALLLKNVLLTLVTFGIYAAWAKAARRRYVWAHTEFHGQRLGFHGTGGELFVGYLKVAAAYLVLFGVPALVGAMEPSLRPILHIAAFLLLMAVLPFAIYASRAYLLSRTSWRGIRFGMVAGATTFARTFLVGSFLTVVTLGLYAPWLACNVRKLLFDNARFGTERFGYDGQGKELFPLWIKGVVLSVFTLGIYAFWMQAALARYHASHTKLGAARVRFDVTGGHLFKIALAQIFGTTLTLGLAFPWIATWSLRSILDTLSVEGQIDFARIGARADAASPAADGFADALGVDLGV